LNTPSNQSTRRYGPALEAHYQFMLWLIPTVEKFPRGQKFLLGDRIQAAALDILEALIEATYSRERRNNHLARANLGVEKLRFLFRLATTLKYLDVRRFTHAARQLDEIGRMIGGWRKVHDAQATQ
jgi:four helix bundle protein